MPNQILCQSEWPQGTPMRSLYHENTYRFRMEPVPGVRKGRGGGGWLRRPRTHRSRTWAFADCDEELSDLKAHVLPTAWEDIPRRQQRSWKKQRLCQSHAMSYGGNRATKMSRTRAAAVSISPTTLRTKTLAPIKSIGVDSDGISGPALFRSRCRRSQE